MKRMLDSLPSGLRVVTNFGLVDICAERSGKHNAAAYLAREHFGIPLEDCASMGDDDNDIALVRKRSRSQSLLTVEQFRVSRCWLIRIHDLACTYTGVSVCRAPIVPDLLCFLRQGSSGAAFGAPTHLSSDANEPHMPAHPCQPRRTITAIFVVGQLLSSEDHDAFHQTQAGYAR